MRVSPWNHQSRQVRMDRVSIQSLLATYADKRTLQDGRGGQADECQ